MATVFEKNEKGKKVKTREEFAPAKNQLFSPAFFHESREIIVMAGLLAQGATYCLPIAPWRNSGFVE